MRRRQLGAVFECSHNEELIKTCPSVFTLAPAGDFRLIDTYFERAMRDEELELVLFCEWDKGWHPTAQSVYRFRPEQEWLESLRRKELERNSVCGQTDSTPKCESRYVTDWTSHRRGGERD